MGTQSQIGWGIKLLQSTTEGGSYTAVGTELLSITPPAPTVENLKVYRSDNTVTVVEKVPGWTDYADTDGELTYTPGNRAAVEDLLGVVGWFKVQYPECAGQSDIGDSEKFEGFLSFIGKETPIKDVMKVKIKIVCNGASAFAAGS